MKIPKIPEQKVKAFANFLAKNRNNSEISDYIQQHFSGDTPIEKLITSAKNAIFDAPKSIIDDIEEVLASAKYDGVPNLGNANININITIGDNNTTIQGNNNQII
ncbi:MAG: hypothetical protein EAZ95_10935 [Bacteroidetes bacterium]|nr:MAG: hypothetical protein EAZ95_10935 [Bacteroidota bacterium]